jgi:hypothetical protein
MHNQGKIHIRLHINIIGELHTTQLIHVDLYLQKDLLNGYGIHRWLRDGWKCLPPMLRLEDECMVSSLLALSCHIMGEGNCQQLMAIPYWMKPG